MDRYSIITGKNYEERDPERIPSLQQRFQEVINKYIGTKNIFDTRRRIKNEISRILVETLDDKSFKDFPASRVMVEIYDDPNTCQVVVQPGNLFTFLLMRGLFIPYPEIEGREEYIDKKNKIRYSFIQGTPRSEFI